MTILGKPVRREIESETIWSHQPVGRGVVVEMTREGVRMREKGRRTWYGPYPWGRLFVMLARMTADQRIAERKAARRARRG